VGYFVTTGLVSLFIGLTVFCVTHQTQAVRLVDNGYEDVVLFVSSDVTKSESADAIARIKVCAFIFQC